MEDKIKFIRRLVRPTITWAVVGSVLGIGIYLAVKYGSQGMADKIVSDILVMVALIVGFWFGSRTPNTPPGQ